MPPTLAPVTKQAYIAEMNRRLRLHPDFRPGMIFLMNTLSHAGSGAQPFYSVRNSMISDGWIYEEDGVHVPPRPEA